MTAARVLTAGPAVTEAGTPPARSTILEPESLIDLGALVSPDGRIRWDVPEGDWILFSFWQRNVPGIASA